MCTWHNIYMTKKTVTINDVAQAAGVSVATVSRVVNNDEKVKPSTKRVVDDVIKQLGYRPNSTARSLATGKTNTIGVFVIGSSLSGPAAILSAVESRARELGFRILVNVYDKNIEADELHKNEVKYILNDFLEANVDAIICVQSYRESAQMLYDFKTSVPMFFAVYDSQFNFEDTNHDNKFFITINQKQGVKLAVEYVKELGHTNLLYIAGPKGSLDGGTRLDEMIRLSKEFALNLNVIDDMDWSPKGAYMAIQKLFGNSKNQSDEFKNSRPTAILTANDLQAFGVQKALYDLNIKVPNKISVIGFDDFFVSDFLIPSLTTVRQPYSSLGSEIMKTAHKVLKKEKIAKLSFIDTKLIIRDSVKDIRDKEKYE